MTDPKIIRLVFLASSSSDCLEDEEEVVEIFDPSDGGISDVTTGGGRDDDGDDGDNDDDGGDDDNDNEELGRDPTVELLSFRESVFPSEPLTGWEATVFGTSAANTRRVDTSSTRVRLILAVMVTCDL